jgi:hypothetical protein
LSPAAATSAVPVRSSACAGAPCSRQSALLPVEMKKLVVTLPVEMKKLVVTALECRDTAVWTALAKPFAAVVGSPGSAAARSTSVNGTWITLIE